LRVLAPLALWMHETNPGVGLVKREALRRHLEDLFEEQGTEDPAGAARRFLADVREHAGLLLERGAGQYGFIHLTFEEYLAAVAIARRGQGDCRPMVEMLSAHVGDAAWREVSRLTIPYLGIIQQLDQVAGEVVAALADERPGAPGEAVVLAGQAVLDAGETGVPAHSRGRVTEALVGTMQGAEVEPALRREAGLILGELDWRPDDLDAFVEVPPGPFLSGDKDTLYGDRTEERVIAHRYWIGKYPVTYSQYARFVEDDGYYREAWWSEAGWAWRKKKGRERPRYWEDDDYHNPIFPVVGVTWYEAGAYCRWLDMQLNVSSSRLKVWMDGNVEYVALDPGTFRVRLPTEEEWERAARGTDGRAYPWGDEFGFDKANVAEKLGEGMGATSVCTYPQGVSPEGVWDMSGNVLEWTGSLYEESSERFVLRGGSWYLHRRDARCASRDRSFPARFSVDYGFRVVVSLGCF
jgi:formylglycine-generating enzyme required for sulfatase activity